jgi:hypothetical protein
MPYWNLKMSSERYGWINRAIPDAELDGFVDRFARWVSSFDKEALTEDKRLVNRSSCFPENAQLAAAGTAFVRTPTRPDTQARISKLTSRGLRERGDLELGNYLGLSSYAEDNIA